MNHSTLVFRNLRHLYLNEGLNGLFAVMVPVMVLFFMHTIGLSLGQVLLGEAIFALTIVLLEVPSGYLADRWGRAKLLLTAEILFFLAFATLCLADNFEMVIIGQVLAGAGLACASGAKDALLFDSLKSVEREGEYRLIRGRLNTIMFSVSVGSTLLGGLIAAEFGLRSVIFLATLFVGMSVVNVLYLCEPPVHEEKSEPVSLKKSWRYVKKHPLVRQIVLFSVVMGLAMKLSFQTLNPYWVAMEVPVVLFGVAMATCNLVAAVASLLVDKLKRWSDFVVLLGLLGLVSGTFLVMATGVPFGVVMVVVLGSLFQIARAWWPVVTEDAINQVTYSHHRATVLSMKSFAQQLGQVVLLPVFGYVADWWSLFTAFGLLGAFVFVAGVLVLWPLRKI